MAITQQKRKKMEKLVYDVFTKFDTSGKNTKKYKELFSSMSDKQFDNFFKALFANDKSYLIADCVDYENNLKIESIENAARVLGISLYEHVAVPFLSDNPENPVVSVQPVPVGYIHIKRTQQMQFKKNTTSTEVSTRSALTGQVTGNDKNARESDTENFVLMTIGADKAAKEFCSLRSDDMVMKSQAYAEISKKGFVTLDELTDSLENKTTLNTIDTFFIGMGLKTDMVTKDLTLKNFNKK